MQNIAIFNPDIITGSLGIAPTFFKLDSWTPGVGFIPIILTKGINQIEKGNCKKKFIHIQKDKNIGAIPCGCNSTSTVALGRHQEGPKVR